MPHAPDFGFLQAKMAKELLKFNFQLMVPVARITFSGMEQKSITIGVHTHLQGGN